MRMRNIAVAGLAVLPLILAGCGGSSNNNSSSSSSSSKPAAAKKVGVILPDAATSPRWENNDRPALDKAIKAAGYTAIIQNASKAVSKFTQLCDSMINQGVTVLMIVNLDSNSGAACEKKALDAGIKSIDYDRLTLGGSASYYVSFDNVQVGKLMGDGLTACLDADKKAKANIVYINGDPTDNNAALFKNGYAGALKPKIDSGAYKLVGDQTGLWDATKAQQAFEQIFTQNNGKVDGVVSANDTMAGGIVTVLNNNKLAGKVPVTGQDASDEGLQRVIAGTQCGTVFKDVNLEADAAAKLAIAMVKNDGSADALANGSVQDTQTKKDVKSVFATPVWVTQANIKAPFDAGYTTTAKVCTAPFKAACTKLGLS
ncbi:MAG: D-xylose transport system substrate-binding protein [Actinomycetota bacterium]|jgi:D-xylose transport system substrate-binding protein|nr:D-xylose transport system substrate-binding protein [Actinomycetota bacterium]MDQ1643443.1 D-xylose transport system substrate-binding protein [Actinomycetota bacterium]